MTSEMDKTDNVVKFIHEAGAMGIRVLPPDINESYNSFTVVGPDIRFGLGAVKGVGESAIESILAARQKVGRFASLLKFCEEVDLRACNKKVLEALIKSGSFDFLGLTRKSLFDQLESTADSAQRVKDEKERGQHSLFGSGGQTILSVPSASTAGQTRMSVLQEWPEEEKLRYEKETLGFYVSGHPLNRYSEEIRLFTTPGVTTETLHLHVDDVVNIAGIIAQLKKNKIKKGPNEGKLMAKFVLDDQYGSVDVVVFSDLYAKYAKWLEDGVAILLTASVKDTGGVAAGRSASLQSAEQSAQQIDDEYGGHPEARGPSRISAYEIREDDIADEDRDPKEVEREKYGDRTNNMSLFGGAPAVPPEQADEDAGEAAGAPLGAEAGAPLGAEAGAPLGAEAGAPLQEIASFASRAAAFHETPITPELNALEIIPLDGIREKKVRELALEVPYPRVTEDTVKKIREIFEDHPGEVPVSVTLIEVPGSGELRLKLNNHFRVQPGPALSAALLTVHASAKYMF
jgi:hypothetical protein